MAELDARLSSALAAWQDSADDVQPPVSAADGTASEGRARQAAVVAADTALTEQQRLLEIVDRAAGAALERVKRARDRVARCQAWPAVSLSPGAGELTWFGSMQG